jgi:hypothetical protein
MKFSINFDSQSVFVPKIEVPFGVSKIQDNTIVKDLANLIKEKEHYILNVLTKKERVTDDDTWITGRLHQYNFLNFEEDCVKYLKEFIKQQYIEFMAEMNQPVLTTYVQCWCNILRPGGRKITVHNHSSGNRPWLKIEDRTDANLKKDREIQGLSYLSGNLSIQTNGTATFFQNPFLDKQFYAIPNFDGELILFPSYVNHTTDKQAIDSERITISFDIITDELYSCISQSKEDPTNYIRLT